MLAVTIMLCLPSGTDITWNSSLGPRSGRVTTQIGMRDNTIVLGGVEVDEPEGIPFISRLAMLGEIDTSDVADPAAP